MIAKQCLGAALLVLASSLAFGQTAEPARIDALVRKLGSSAYVQREQACKELEAIGPPALEALRRAAKTSDVEMARRSAELLRNLETQLVTKQVLAPKHVRLNVKDVSVPEAISELSRLSGYPIQFLGDATKFADKLTLDTGETSFWQALEQLCAAAKLMERVDLSAPPAQTYYPRVAKNGMRRPIYVGPQQAPTPAPIILVSRGAEKSVVSLAGSIKAELRITRDAGAKELNLMFIVGAEPRFLNNGITGQPIIDTILDQRRRKLEFGVDPAKDDKKLFEDAGLDFDEIGTMQLPRRFAQIRIKDGADAPKEIKELAGRLTYQLDVPNVTLAKIDKVMEATGKSVAAVNGGTLKINSIRKKDDFYILDVTLENCTPNPFGNNVIINGGTVIIRGNVNIQGGMVIGPGGVRMNGGTQKDLPDLVDAKGNKFKVIHVENDGISFVNGGSSRSAQILFQANPGQAEPRELVLFGTRTHTITVPFRFENVALPK